MFSMMLTSPVVGAKSWSAIPEMIIQDKKCGIYTIVWVNRLNRLKASSFRRMARMMGAGKPNNKSRKLRPMVFLRAYRKSRLEKA
ncbi:hypothetical protein D3C86_1672160 [compost metagenome]